MKITTSHCICEVKSPFAQEKESRTICLLAIFHGYAIPYLLKECSSKIIETSTIQIWSHECRFQVINDNILFLLLIVEKVVHTGTWRVFIYMVRWRRYSSQFFYLLIPFSMFHYFKTFSLYLSEYSLLLLLNHFPSMLYESTYISFKRDVCCMNVWLILCVCYGGSWLNKIKIQCCAIAQH